MSSQTFIRGLGSILTGGKNFYWNILFSCSKASDANIGIIANFVYHGKTRITFYIKDIQ